MQPEALNARVPISAELIRSKSSHQAMQMQLLAPFSDSLAEHAGTALSQLGRMPVKVTVISNKVEKLTPLYQAEAGFDIKSSSTNLSCWGSFDRQFDDLLCDICLGSGGTRKGDNQTDRPVTIFEKKLRGLIFERLTQATAKAFSEIGEQTDLVVQPRARASIRKSQPMLPCYCVKLLVNAFDAACEFELLLSFAECLILLGDESSDSEPNTTQCVLDSVFFPLEVYLQPGMVDVRQILNLAPGEILKLSIAASAPVELRMNGQMLSRGTLCFENNRSHVRVLENAPFSAVTNTASAPTRSAGQNGN